MTMTQDKVINILAKQFGKDPNDITIGMNIAQDLAADSLDLMEIVVELESQFRVKIEDDEYDNSFTVAQIVDLINGKIANPQ
jgi:acyl carrier protein